MGDHQHTTPKDLRQKEKKHLSAQAKKGSHSNIGHIPSAIDSQMQRKDAQGIFLASELCFHTLLQKELGTKAI